MSYTPQNAIDLVQNFAHGIPLTNVQSQICDMVNSQMWVFYPWSWSIVSLTAIPLTDGTQDYTPSNTDILRILKGRLVRTDVSPQIVRDLAQLANLTPDLERKLGIEQNTAFGYFGSQNLIRLMAAMSIGSTQTVQFQGEYQQKPTAITDATMTSALSFPDHYFNVFYEGVKWQVLALADDPRAGGMQYAKNGTMLRQYSGQYAVFRDSLLDMARTEDLGSGDEYRWPEEPLGTGHVLYPGLFGL